MADIPLYPWQIYSTVCFVTKYIVPRQVPIDESTKGVRCSTQTAYWRGTCDLPHPVHAEHVKITWQRRGELGYPSTLAANFTTCWFSDSGIWRGEAHFKQVFLPMAAEDVALRIEEENKRWLSMPNSMINHVTENQSPTFDDSYHFVVFEEQTPAFHLDFATSLAAVGAAVEGWEIDAQAISKFEKGDKTAVTPIVWDVG